MTEVFAAMMPMKKKKMEEEAMMMKKKASEETVDVLETAETEETIDLSVGSEETVSEAENTRAALVDFVYNRLGKKLNKGE
jgi:glycine cleavage system pyridoxal-binding protein P